jgi:pimeloyl-ACP methyl ester carboxylesterase
MNDVVELKEYARVHARGQRIARYGEILARIRSDDGAVPGSWVGEWSRAARELEERDDDLAASRCYALARFPYVDGAARADAQERCVAAFDRWRAAHPDIQPLTVKLAEGELRCWTSGLSTGERKPLLVVMGGIVTVKEQWAAMLVHARRLGMAAIVAEMPSVGENTLRYEPASWRMLAAILDEVADRAAVDQAHLTALSFSGHLALRCALDDARIRGIVTVGAPVREFFTDPVWRDGLPQLTVDTLAHLTGLTAEQVVGGGLDDWALPADRLGELDIRVAYAVSLRDEIIPPGDPALIRRLVRRLSITEFDDVHASPDHVLEMQLWTTAALLRNQGIRNPQTAVLNALRRLLRLRRGLPRRS